MGLATNVLHCGFMASPAVSGTPLFLRTKTSLYRIESTKQCSNLGSTRTVSWRGNGTFDNSQFVPQIFNLTAGPHQLIARGREANTFLQDLTVVPYP